MINEINDISASRQYLRNNNIICMIMTSDKTINTRGFATWATWAQYCKIAFFSCNCSRRKKLYSDFFTFNKKVSNPSEVPILYLDIEESYMKMAQKAIEILKLTKKMFGLENDWFLMADDDTFIFFDNLLKFIKHKNYTDPVVYGFSIVDWIVKDGYPQGGAGILFTKESMRRLYSKLAMGLCNYVEGFSDVAIGYCMELANVTIGDSTDSCNRERFHMHSLKRYFGGPFDNWMLKHSKNSPKNGINCCAEDSISFHYTEPEDMIKYAKMNFSEALKKEYINSMK